MTHRLRDLAICGTLTLGMALAAGCKKDDKGGKDGKGAQGSGGAAAGLVTEDQTLELKEFTVKAKVPKGWTKQAMGTDTVMWSSAGRGMWKSWIRVSSTCEGYCDKIAANIKEAGPKAMTQQQGFKIYTDLKLVANEATPGGHRYRLAFTYQGKPGVQLATYFYMAGWTNAVMCAAMLLEDEAKRADAFAKLCDSLAVKKK